METTGTPCVSSVSAFHRLFEGLQSSNGTAIILYHFMLTRPHSVPEDFALYVRSNSTR